MTGQEELQRQLASIEALPLLALHPGLADACRCEIDQLQEALADHDAAKLEAVPKLRALIERVVLTPNAAGDGLQIEVIGRMDQVLSLASGKPQGVPAAPRTGPRARVR